MMIDWRLVDKPRNCGATETSASGSVSEISRSSWQVRFGGEDLTLSAGLISSARDPFQTFGQ